MSHRDESAPAWAYESVHVVAPDPGWLELAERYIDEIGVLLGDRLASRPVHVGSTAVPGLPAKPIIDLQARVTDPADLIAERREALAHAHWHVVPRELDRRPWRWFVVRSDRDEQRRLAHLHLMALDETRWCLHLAFRDRLRGSAALVREYAVLKARAAATRYGDDREGYTFAKSEFIQNVLEDPA